MSSAPPSCALPPPPAEVERVLERSLAELQRRYGPGAVMRLDGRVAERLDAPISTGSIGLDAALGVGGLPRGRVVEIYGGASSGKTTLALHAIAEVQRGGGVAAFIDAEHALDPRYAGAVGVSLPRLLFSQPDCGEQALEIAEGLIRSGVVDLIAVDSVAALTPEAELYGGMGDYTPGLQARMMSKALRRLSGALSRSRCCVIFLNQLRSRMGSGPGPTEIPVGGSALKYYASVRLETMRAGRVPETGAPHGIRIRVKVIKNKLAPPLTRAELDLRFGAGICRASELLEIGALYGLVSRSGGRYRWGEVSLGRGPEAARARLVEEPELAVRLRGQILARVALDRGAQ